MKKRDDQRDGPGPADNDPSPPKPHPVAPEIAIELGHCLPGDQTHIFKQGVMDALEKAGFGNGEVLTECIGGLQRVGIWTTRLTAAGEQDRQLGLPEINMFTAAERADLNSFAFRVSAQLIDQATADAWDKMPKRLNSDTQAPDPHGDVVLHSYSLDYIAPDRVKLTIKATKLITDPAPDVDLTLVRKDTLTALNEEIRCHSDSSGSADRNWLWAFVIPLALVYPLPFFQVVFSEDPKSGHEGGPGCAAAALFPRQILIPDTDSKMVFRYERVGVNQAGITAAGRIGVPVTRDQAVSIGGPTDLNAFRGQTSASGRFTIGLRDMRPPVSIDWSGAEFEHPHGFNTEATFLIGAQTELQIQRNLTVRVKDADHQTAEATHGLTIHIRPDER
jgi:hypothetical protein